MQGPDKAVLEAAALQCREALSTSNLQQSMRSAGQPSQPMAGMALSNLASHDLHTGAFPGSSNASRPNPFDRSRYSRSASMP